jgi:hypothetical protein
VSSSLSLSSVFYLIGAAQMGCASSVAATPPASSAAGNGAAHPKATAAAAGSPPEKKKAPGASLSPPVPPLPRADTGLFEKELAGHRMPAAVMETPTIKEVAAARKKTVELDSPISGVPVRIIKKEVLICSIRLFSSLCF